MYEFSVLLSKESQWKFPFPYEWNDVVLQHVELWRKCFLWKIAAVVRSEILNVIF